MCIRDSVCAFSRGAPGAPLAALDDAPAVGSSGSITTMHRSSTVFVMVRAPARRSFFDTGRARTATESVAWLTPLFLSTDVNFTEASTSALTASCARLRVFFS